MKRRKESIEPALATGSSRIADWQRDVRQPVAQQSQNAATRPLIRFKKPAQK